jgi:hypothetical protein
MGDIIFTNDDQGNKEQPANLQNTSPPQDNNIEENIPLASFHLLSSKRDRENKNENETGSEGENEEKKEDPKEEKKNNNKKQKSIKNKSIKEQIGQKKNEHIIK